MRKVELYRAHSQLDLEDTELFIEQLMNHRKDLLERQDSAGTVHAEAASLVLPDDLVQQVTRRGPYLQANSATGLLKAFIADKDRFSAQSYHAFLKEKRPELGPTAGYQAIYTLLRKDVIARAGGDNYTVLKQSDSN